MNFKHEKHLIPLVKSKYFCCIFLNILFLAKKRPPLKRESRDEIDESTPNIDGNDIRFVFRYITYQFDELTNMFITVSFNYNRTFDQIHAMSDGILEDDHEEFFFKYGPCTMEIIIKSWYKLLFEEVLNAFYFFQVFCVIIWACNAFYRS